MTEVPQDIRIDAPTIAPRERHATIMATFARLQPNQAIDLVNDHDPKPLYYQFAAEHRDEFTWSYRQEGPEVWEVEIRKVASR